MAAADSERLRAPAECVIKVDDTEITDLYPFVSEVKVEMSRKAASTCTIVLESVRQESGEWNIQDSGIFQPWKKIMIEAAFGEHVEEVMRGYIREVISDYPDDMGSAAVTIIGQDESILLDRTHIRSNWSTEDEPMTDGQIAQRIASDNGLDSETEDGLENVAVNADGTPIKLLRDRAEANGYEMFVREGKLHFRSPDLEGEPQPAIMVYAGDDSSCTRFKVRFDGHKPDKVGITRASDVGSEAQEEIFEPDLPLLGRDPANSESMGLEPFTWYMPQPHGSTETEVLARAQAKANENAWKIVAEGELDGSLYGHVLLNYLTVTVDGVGDVDGGLYYVDQVTHSFTPDGYTQTFRLLSNATGDTSQSSSEDPIAGVR